ncbi:MAG: hypothetical protein V4813_07425 [Gemmatimonadota bacterium]
MALWIRVFVLGTIGGLAGSRLAQFSDAAWWQVTPWVLLVLLWAGLWKHRAQLQQRWSKQ